MFNKYVANVRQTTPSLTVTRDALAHISKTVLDWLTSKLTSKVANAKATQQIALLSEFFSCFLLKSIVFKIFFSIRKQSVKITHAYVFNVHAYLIHGFQVCNCFLNSCIPLYSDRYDN